MSTVVGIDLGTQSLKVIFYDAHQRLILASESSALDINQDENGKAEQAAGWWVTALTEALHKVPPDIRASAECISVSGQQHGFVPLSQSGTVLAPVKLWCDTSTETECAEIMGRFGGREACIQQLGNPILPGYTASKIAWLKRHNPDAYTAMATILLPHDYLNYFLTGEMCMEAGDASGTGFVDIRRRVWSSAMLKAIDPDRDLLACLPDLQLEPGVIGKLRAETARTLGLPAGIPVASGGGDNMMGAIGTGNISPGSVTMSLGTSGTVYAFADQAVIDPTGSIAAFCSSSGGWLPLMCTMNCTVTTELLRSLLDTDIDTFEALISQASPGADGLLVLPFFNGERTPDLPRAKGSIIGMDVRNTTRENVLRAGVEGATFALSYGLRQLQKLGVKTEKIVLTGGGAHSPTWRQIVADVCDAPVTVLQQNEGAGFGAALQALAVLEASSLEPIVDDHLARDIPLCCEPQANSVEVYREIFDTYERAMGAITPLYHPGHATQ